MKKTVLAMAAFLLSLTFTFIGCEHGGNNGSGNNNGVETDSETGWKNYTGTAVGTGRGYKSDITVNLTLTDGFIKAVDITHNDTPKYADQAVVDAKRIIVETNSFKLDAITSASYTRNGIMEAGRAALKSKGLID